MAFFYSPCESVCRKPVGRCVCGVNFYSSLLGYFENILARPFDEGRGPLQATGRPAFFIFKTALLRGIDSRPHVLTSDFTLVVVIASAISQSLPGY
jgi:hypothetical protein